MATSQAPHGAADEAGDLISFRSPTEERNQRTTDIDMLPADQIVARIVDEDASVMAAVQGVTSQIGALVAVAVETIRAGGCVHYIGAGTSGRLGVLDAVELLPTYGVGEEWFQAHLAGGDGAMFKSVEGVEDRPELGRQDADSLRAGDLLVGLAASGRTPYVRGAIELARERGVHSALITANPHAELAALVDIAIILDTGPEAVTGSTRMKAATAQKIALNAFSTSTMISLGKTYSNFMVDVRPSNEKLKARVIRLLRQATGVDPDTAVGTLDAADGDLKVALVSLLVGQDGDPLDVTLARAALQKHQGSVQSAVAELRDGS